jgi:PAS domain S-box-containing protein
MSEFLSKLFSSDFMGHGYCYFWRPEIVWLHVASDATVTLAYYLIPLALIYFVRKRRDVPFHWVFAMFGLFIFSCGTTHLMDIWTLWHGTYRLAGLIKAITAASSVATAIALVPLLPRAIALPSPAQLRAINEELGNQIGERRRIQEALVDANDTLEARVRERTRELASAIEQLRVEVAQRQRAEETLRKQASLLELAHDAIVVRDTNDNITYWNPGAAEIYGWQKHEAVGKLAPALLEFTSETDMESVKKQVIREGRWEGELTQRRRDGRRIVVASRWALQLGDDGKPIAILQINTDITERKRAEEQTKELAALVENSKDFIGLASIEGKVLFVNAAGQSLAESPGNDDLRRTQLLDFVAEDDRDRVMTDVLPSVKRDGHWEGETLFRNFRTAAVIPMWQHVFLIAGEGGNPRIATISRDISERKRAEAALQTAQAQLAHVARVTTMGELTASIAHEVNQPLAAVVANGDACLRWLGATEPNIEEARAAATRIVKEGRRASEVIGRIRALMKKSPQQVSAIDMNALIEEVLTLMRHDLHRHSVSLRIELAVDLPPVEGDTVGLQQALLNLVMNARDATRGATEGLREIVVKSHRPSPDRIAVSVCDSGVGIDPSDIEQFFKPFFTTKTEGMGMGLAISRSAIEAHGGKLWATPNEGPGTTFEFFLPTRREA